MYQHIAIDTPIENVIHHPAFRGRGRLLFPWDDDSRYHREMTMADAPSLHLWHTNMDAFEMVKCVNHIIDEINQGRQVLYDFYTDEEKRADPSKRDTGLFYFRGKSGAPFAVVSAGGGFYYVGSLHGSFPHAIELSRKGYNAFVLKYRVGQGETVSSHDLIAAVQFICSHSEVFGTVPDNYSLWGGSAGARMSSNVSYGEGGIRRSELLHPAATVMAYTTFAGHPTFSANDPPAFMIAGTNDWIVPAGHMPARADRMRKAGIPVECTILPNVKHGFGTGKGMEAEDWIDKAVAFWEKHMMNNPTQSEQIAVSCSD